METAVVYLFLMLWFAVLACVLVALLDVDHQVTNALRGFLEAILPTTGGDL